jgi:signal peptidase I
MKPTLDIGDFVLVWKLPYGIRMPGSRQELVDFGDPEVGDVIVFRPPHEPQTNYIKRVIAVPGDHVRYDFTRKRLYLNGELVPITGKETTSSDGLPVRRYEEELNGELHSTYVVQQNRRPSYAEIYSGAALQGFAETMIPEEGIVVPEGKYFAMGDNRDNSLDSRFWGFVEEDQISGKAVYIWLHWPSIFSIPSFKNFGSIQ